MLIDAHGPDGTRADVVSTAEGTATYVPFAYGPSQGSAYPLLAGAPNAPLLDSCQSGHPWTLVNADAASNADDTADYYLGSRSVKLVTNGDAATLGSGTQARWTFANAPVDLTGKALRIWFKIDSGSWNNMASVHFWAYTDGGVAVSYRWQLTTTGAAVATQYATESEWVSITLPFGTAGTGNGGTAPYVAGNPVRSAVNAFAFEVRDIGNGSKVTAHFGGVAMVDEAWRLPNGCMTISFDDSYGSVYTLAKPYMDKYGFAGTPYVIADNIDTSGRLSHAALRDMQSDGWEISGHCYRQAVHDARLTSISGDDLDYEFRMLRAWMITNGYAGADHYAYPGGVFTNTIVTALKKYFATARTTYATSGETLPPGDPYRIRAITGSETEANLKLYIDQAYANRSWVIINWHDVNASPNGSQQDLAVFQHVMDYAASVGIPVRTPSQVLKGMI